MECKAGDERDYDVVKAKVPKRDKDGHDITADKLGTGGRRREDGTLSALAYDFELIEDSDDSELDNFEDKFLEYALAEQRMRIAQEEDFYRALEFVSAIADATVTFLENHPEVAVKIVDGVMTFGHYVTGQFKAIRTKLKSRPKQEKKSAKLKRGVFTIKATALLNSQVEKPPVKSVKEEQERQPTMTVEQAKNEVLNILGHYIEMKKGFQRLSKANVIDPQKIGFDAVIAQLEGIVQSYPALMDVTIESSILSINLDEIEMRKVKEALLIQPNDHKEDKIL